MGFTEAAWTLMSNSSEPGGGHLRTGALPARHSCGLAQLSCFPFRNLLGQDIMKVFKARVGLTEPSTPTGAQRKRGLQF